MSESERVNKKEVGKLVILKEGYILDLATSKPVDIRKPEENIRQEYEKILHEDYDYEYEQMDIEVQIQRGEQHSKKNKNERADIVIYKTTDKTKRDQNKDILGIIETKRPTKREGIRQLMSYMTATSCLWGVWTNGEEIEYVYRDTKTGEIKTEYIFQIPSNGESFEDIERITKESLKPVKNLKPVFKRIYYTLYSNTNIARKEKLGSEMIRLIFCKIYDELYDRDKPPKFKIGFNDSPQDVKKNVEWLWDKVKDKLVEEGVFEKHEKIVLDPKSVVYIVSELEKYSLTETDKDVIGDAFEVFAERQFVGDKGEYFTPRTVVKMAVDIINPQPEEKVLDPACGSGGFLIYALEHVWGVMNKSPKYKGKHLEDTKKEFARKYFYGIDKEIDLVKICKAYMSIIGDGRSNIVKADSLKSPEEWETITRSILTEDGTTMKEFDVILTNPPFGSKIKVKHEYILKKYDLGHEWKFEDGEWTKTNKTKDTEPQILFIELCLNLLRDGGRMAIVLPDGIFGNPTDGYIREWIKDKAEIMAVIDCPHTTFMPHTHTKTSVLFLKKWDKTQNKNYPIMMSVVEKCGHDNRGNETYREEKDGEVLDEEFSKVAEIYSENKSRVIKGFDRLGFTLFEGSLREGILIPRYYDPDTIKQIEKIGKSGDYELKSVQDLIDDGTIAIKGTGGTASSNEYNIYDDIPFLRTSDIGSWETRNYAIQNVNELTYLRYKDKQDLKEGDILFIKDGTYRIGETLILTKYDLRMLVQSHFLKIRSLDWSKLDPYLLLYLLHIPIVRRQIEEKTFVQATLSTIGDRLNEIILPIPKDKKIRNKIAKDMKDKILKRAELRHEIRDIFGEN
ncbi:MAG: N-6 DNA methylase [Candidatus Woesearchaeota archaeon]|nr:MAG: N-6 DNA methylase [Candidatus Woesearchaeota archaeon]